MNYMQNEEKRRRKIFFEFGEQEDKENDTDRISVAGNELQRKIDIECYNKVMKCYPNYLSIVYTYVQKFRQRLKILISIKVKFLRDINNRMIFINL
jgi:hypothetical protein